MKNVTLKLKEILADAGIALRNMQDKIKMQNTEQTSIPVKRFDVLDVIEDVKHWYGSRVVNSSSNPPQVWVKGNIKDVSELNKHLAKKYSKRESAASAPKVCVTNVETSPISKEQGTITILTVGC